MNQEELEQNHETRLGAIHITLTNQRHRITEMMQYYNIDSMVDNSKLAEAIFGPK